MIIHSICRKNDHKIYLIKTLCQKLTEAKMTPFYKQLPFCSAISMTYKAILMGDFSLVGLLLLRNQTKCSSQDQNFKIQMSCAHWQASSKQLKMKKHLK